MSRVSIRLRLTAAFAAAMVVVLAAAALFVYVRLRADLNESVNAALAARVEAVAASGAASAGAAGDDEEGFAQVLGASGELLDSAGGARGAVRVDGGLVERRMPGIEGTVRILRSGAVIVGQSLEDRDEALAGVVASFAVGGPIAVLIASLLGYSLAAAGLGPIEAMRRRAGEISLAGDDDRLPLPAAHDEVHRLGMTLNEMLERLQGALEGERRFVADAGHELRTPVAVIKTELEGALRAGGHEPRVREALVAAVEECDNLAQLSEDLLIVGRAGALPVRPEPLPVQALLEGVRQRFADRARERGRSIAVDAAAGLVVVGDELRLRQALGNLVDNALRHGAGEIVMRGMRANGGVALVVEDAGPGFGDDIAGHAFERFARSDSARGRDGTGLGLAIVRMIVEAHGGRAEIVPAAGANVRIWLPQGDLSQPT